MTAAVVIVGRAEIAHRLGRSERTVSRWIRLGVLRAAYAGPGPTNLLVVAADEIERVRALFACQALVA